MLKSLSIRILLFILLIIFPFLFVEVIQKIIETQSNYTFSEARFLEEYFKFVGTLFVVLLGAIGIPI